MHPLRASVFLCLALFWMGASLDAQTLAVTTGTANASATGATLGATASTGSSAAIVSFDYGTSTFYGSQAFYPTPVNANSSSNSVLEPIAGLTPGTTYHYRAKITDSTGTVFGSDATFTTGVPPTVATNVATAVSDLGATLNGTITANGGVFTPVTFSYGLTPSLGTSIQVNSYTITGNTPTPVSWTASHLLAGTTYYYQVSTQSDNGNLVSFTTAPAATPPTAGTNSGATTTTTTATVSASANPGSSETTVVIDYGPTTDYGSQVVYGSTLDPGSTFGALSIGLSGLTPGTTYHYRARAFNNEGTGLGSDATFTTAAVPTVTTGAPTGITDTQATLAGSGNATGVTYTASFDYGPTTAYGLSVTSATSVRGTTTTNVTASTLGLVPATNYHFRLKLTDSSGAVYYGSDATFTTNAPASPPTASTSPATSVTAGTAYFNASTVSAGSSPTTVTFQYGTDTNYGSTASFITLPIGRSYGVLSEAVTGLQPATTYHYRVTATNNEGSATGNDFTFTTLTAATATTTAATNVTSSGATFGGNVNVQAFPATVTTEYGLTTSYGSSLAINDTFKGNFGQQLVISNLLPSTTYHYRIRLDNPDGTLFGDDMTFTTLPQGTVTPTAASIGSVSVTPSATSAVLTASNVNAGNTPAAVAFEYGTTTGYGTSVTYPNGIPASTSGNASVTITGLQPDTLYHFRADVTNSAGTVSSADTVFITPGTPTISTGAATNVSDIYATLNGAVDPQGGTLNLFFDYGPTKAYGTVVSLGNAGTETGSFPVSTSVSGLTPGTLYHYHLYAVDGNTVVYDGGDITLTTGSAAAVATITSGPATLVDASTATVSAYDIFAGASPGTVSWDYGTDTNYGSMVAATSTLGIGENDTEIDGHLLGLTPSTTYHYRAKITNAQGTVRGSDETFTTAAAVVSATTAPATQLTSSTATLNGADTSNGGTSLITFQYGPDTNYGTSVPAGFTPGVGDTAAIMGLQPGATYHYRIVNTNTYGTAFGMDMTFTTLTGPVGTPPIVSTGTATGSATGAATFRGTVDSNGLPTLVAFEYGTTTSYSSGATTPMPAITTGGATAVSASVTGLGPSTTIHYRIVAVNAQGITYGADAVVRMVTPPTLSSVLVTNVTASLATISGQGMNTVTGPTGSFGFYVEYGTTTNYGTVVQGPTILPVLGSPHLSLLLGNSGLFSSPPLQSNTTYHCRLVAYNPGGYTFGNDIPFTTQVAPPRISVQPVTGLTVTSATINYNVTETSGADLLSADYGTTASYGFNQAMAPGMAPANGSLSASTTLTGLMPGTTYHYHLRATRTSGTSTSNTFSVGQTFTTYTQGDYWRLQNFGNTGNAGDAADSANPTGDGINNLMKYALGLNPNVPSSALPKATPKNYGGTEYLSYTFVRNPNATDITYEVDAADNPAGPWSAVATSAFGAVTSGPGFVGESPGGNGMINVEVHDTTDMSTVAARFMRLQVTR